MLLDERELTQRASEIETLLADIDSFPDEEMRAKTLEIVQNLLMLYGEGMAHMLSIIQLTSPSPVRENVLEALARDELVSHLLLLHDLHPIDVETRVLGALQEVRPYLESHGGNVELLGIEGGVARLRLQGSCSGCPSSTMTLKLAIEEAIQKAAPELEGVVAEGVTAPAPINFLPAAEFVKRKKPAVAQPAWTEVTALPPLADGGLATADVDGSTLLFIMIEDSYYAYRNACAVCGESLERAHLRGAELTCGACGHHFDVRRAGRCLDAPDKALQPIPLLVQNETITVALDRM